MPLYKPDIDSQLIEAVVRDRPDDIRRLVAAGANVNHHNDTDTGETPLTWAAAENKLTSAKLLVELGADVNLPMIDGTMPLDVAVCWSSPEFRAWLKSRGAIRAHDYEEWPWPPTTPRLPPEAADAVITSLNEFIPGEDGTANVKSLEEIVWFFDGFLFCERVVEAMFGVMERTPEADLGTPGPLVHAIESSGVAGFEPQLLASVRKQPGRVNVWMLNRVLNSTLEPPHRARLLDILRSVTAHPNASAATKQSAERFLHLQAKREGQ